MIVLFREVLPGFSEHGTARTALGVEASRRVWLFGELARDAGSALTLRLHRRRLGVRLLTARRRQRRVTWRFRRSAELDFELGDAGVQRLHLCEQFVDTVVPGGDLRQEPVDPSQHRRHEIGAIGARRIDLSMRHGERESARRSGLNTSDPSHNAAEG